ncbi:penicillin-binding transpeptidase domain-containing protein [Streptomyces litchfieldiae]|uniref:Penicillin-binding transpeptidase domain-containing protein n=1 Tax=Streptomyces litchfieldiae TaxID=3075543 RepID=A0ABU2MLX5_9ACTN|nr:penicillin-binding transpeptidase domain-containing protein [Streptomyces sp. DSM 44938]MDT0342119.1 penicillin-binding transpeptidase domain-containing protein [Streptomyces sp. DSM 44938]
MNKPMRRVAVFCGLLILALLLRVNWVQFVQADELQEDKNNRRVNIERYAHPRGDIIVDGEPITGSEETDDPDYRYERTFTDGEMWAPVTGYSSQAYDTSMLEGVHDSILTGDDDRLFFNNTIDMFTGEDQRGGNVVTTLNADAQRAAFEGLGDKKGAVAAIDPGTGEILALVSTPSYDPSTFSGYGADDQEAWEALQNDPDQPMLNRALRETYPPGSTFKIVTAAAALENGIVEDVEEETDYGDPYILPDTNNQELGNQVPGVCADANIRDAIRYSCNSVFAGLSNDVGNEDMIAMAEEFGYNQEHFTPVRANASAYPEDNRPQNAQAGIGQASNRATPLQMAMVAAAVANNGTLMAPYMVDQLVAPNLNVIEQSEPDELSEPLSSENAQQLQSAMEYMVDNSSIDVSGLETDGVRIGGKTGTAQHGENNSETPYAWFISYAMTDEGSPVAVAVVVEDGDVPRDDVSGSGLAAPIAVDVMEAVLAGENAG